MSLGGEPVYPRAELSGALRSSRLAFASPRANHRGHRDPFHPLGRDQGAHGGEELLGEERVEGTVLDSHRQPLAHLDLDESGSLQLPDEVTLRQRAGDSPGPGCGMSEDLGGKVRVLEGHVGHTELSARP